MYIVIFAIILIVLFILTQNTSNSVENFEFDDLLFTDYKKDFTCSKWLDRLPKHARLNNTGGIMYVSHKPPFETNCWPTRCPHLIKDDITPHSRDHFSNRSNSRNLTCWSCV